MRRAALIMAVLIPTFPAQAKEPGAPATRFTAKTEYRQDALDYDGNEMRFIRDSATVTFGESAAGFTHVHIGDRKEDRFTWYIDMRGISPHFECTIGNYYLNFGAGLLVGKKKPPVPDPFSRKTVVSDGAPSSPCGSGSPLHAFRGIAAGPAGSFGPLSLSLTGFYSSRERFVRNDRSLPDVTGSSFTSILLRTRKDYRYSEPVEISDAGGIVMLRIGGHLLLQSYFIHTSIDRSCSRRLLWDYGDRGMPEGVLSVYSYGFFARYRDDAIEMFMELGFPNAVHSTAAGGRRRRSGTGVLFGLKFRHQGCTLSFTGKHTDSGFYASYSSGDSRAETSWMAEIGVRPLRGLTLGCASFAEKKAAVAGYERYRPYAVREDAFISYRAPGKGSFTATVSHLEEGGNRGVDRSLRLKSSAEVLIMKSVSLRLRGTLQKKGRSRYSGSIGAGLSLRAFHFFRLDLRYARYHISPGNPVYASRAAFRDSISRMASIDTTSDSVACRITSRCRGSRITVGYEHRFSGTRSIQSRIEASATLLLE